MRNKRKKSFLAFINYKSKN